MASLELARKVQDVIAASLELDPTQIRPDRSFRGDLATDSLDVIEVVFAFEREFGIDVPDEAIPSIRTVQDAIDYVASHVP
jgi:acyl carrier protein